MRDTGVMTARDNAQTEHRHPDALAEVVVIGVVAWAFALFPLPISTTVGLIFPDQTDSITAVLTWGLVVAWAAFTLLVIGTGQLRNR